MVYGAVNPTFTASYSGFVNGDEDASVLSGAPAHDFRDDEQFGAGRPVCDRSRFRKAP